MQKFGRLTWLLLPALCFLECADPPVTSTSLPEFNYPLSPGTRWWYSYSYLAGGASQFSWTHGGQIWEVAPASLPNSATILVSRIDTLSHIDYSETTFVNVTESQTSFPVSIDADKRVVRWPQLTHLPVGAWADSVATVPRFVESLSDTLTIGGPTSSRNWARARYLSGIGLISWDVGNSSLSSSVREKLVFDSLIVR